jgi:hypothetical protein
MAPWDALRRVQAQHVEANGTVQVADIQVGRKQPTDRHDGHGPSRIDFGRGASLNGTRGTCGRAVSGWLPETIAPPPANRE